MSQKAEQINLKGVSTGKGNWKRFLKKITSKKRRRKGKKLLDEAPPDNRYDGWAY